MIMNTMGDMAILDMLALPFMQRAFLAGAVLALLLATLGIFVTIRKMAFFGDGIAHSSLAGIAIAVLAGFSPLPVALLWGIAIALLIYWLERSTRLPSDTLIGILFTASMALGVVLMSRTDGYQPELVSFLFGSILAIRTTDLFIIAGSSIILLAWTAASFKHLAYMSLSEESAVVAGVPVRTQTIILYAALAAATVLGVKILGIILVSALMLLPSATSRLLTHTFRGHVMLTLVISEVMMLSGLALSYLYDLPSGATVILVATALFFLAVLMRTDRA